MLFLLELTLVDLLVLVNVFFFQAEDGIRDLVRSRGLGDVYKRQQSNMEWPLNKSFAAAPDIAASANPMIRLFTVPKPVSYTHLTLPTSDLV